MEANARRFLRIWAVAFVICGCATVALNYFTDPYRIFDVRGFHGLNARKPAGDTQQYLMKAYDVFRARPRTIVLGSSRAAVGIDALSPAWPLRYRPVYNLGLSGGSPYTAYRYLQHVMSRERIALVILALEFQYFVDRPLPQKPGFELRLQLSSDGRINPEQSRERNHDLLTSTLSLDALLDSVFTLSGNISGSLSDLSPGHWDYDVFRQVSAARGPYPVFVTEDLDNFHWYFGKPAHSHMMVDGVQAVLNLCKANATRVIVIINPSHADEHEMLDLVGDWAAFEDWKRELLDMVTLYNTDGQDNRVDLWDFDDYDAYSTEPVTGSQQMLKDFLDPSHYTTRVGDAMLRRVFGADSSSFGILLRPENIETHLRTIRDRREQYRERYPGEVRRVARVYDVAASQYSR